MKIIYHLMFCLTQYSTISFLFFLFPNPPFSNILATVVYLYFAVNAQVGNYEMIDEKWKT